MTTYTVKVERDVPVTAIHARCEVRYWEDAEVDGAEDVDGKLIPCRKGDFWDVTIDLATGKIAGWPSVAASVHYKVCDAGSYELLGSGGEIVATRQDTYVPRIMCPGDNGYGDYVIMDIGSDGVIVDWIVDLDDFAPDR